MQSIILESRMTTIKKYNLKTVPEPNGVEKSEFVAGVELNNGVVLPNREGVDAGTDVAEPKSEV